MYLKPYFYYRQQYPGANNSDEAAINSEENASKEAAGGVNNGEPVLDQAAEAGKKDTESIDSNSRFQEVAPGIFQFKHPRPDTDEHSAGPVLRSDKMMAWPSHPENKQPDEFARIGTFPGAGDYGLPVYQFT